MREAAYCGPVLPNPIYLWLGRSLLISGDGVLALRALLEIRASRTRLANSSRRSRPMIFISVIRVRIASSASKYRPSSSSSLYLPHGAPSCIEQIWLGSSARAWPRPASVRADTQCICSCFSSGPSCHASRLSYPLSKRTLAAIHHCEAGIVGTGPGLVKGRVSGTFLPLRGKAPLDSKDKPPSPMVNL